MYVAKLRAGGSANAMDERRARRRWAPRLIAIVCLLLARPALAAPSDADRATARELGSAGVAALEAKDYATAVDRLSRAIALYDAPTLRLARARALRGMGRFVSASEDYHAILVRTPLPSDPPPIVQATRDAKTELPGVEASIAHLTVTVTGGPADVRVDGADWPSATVGIPRPLDPGEHLVEAIVGGTAVQGQRVTLSPGQDGRVDLAVTAPLTGTQPPAPPPSAPLATGAATSVPNATAAPASHSTDHTAAIVTAAISGALAAGAVVTGIMAMSAKSDFNEQNRPDVPHDTKENLHNKASSLALVSTVLTGAAVVGGGISIYLFVAPAHSDQRASLPATARRMNMGFVFSKRF
jgi:hypothetical protein